MSDRTARLALKKLVDGQEMDAFEVNRALNRLDSLSDVYLLDQFVETPPSTPADGDMYLTGGVPTGAWTGETYKIAYCLDGGWKFRDPFDGLRAFVATSGGFIVYINGNWLDWSSLISAAEASIASTATCDIGAQGALFLQVTGTTAITSLGIVPGKLRFLRFAQALTLTYNATSLILPGGASIVTAAGDCAVFTSDSGGNWRCRSYAPADGSGVFTTLTTSGAATLGGALTTTSGNRINPGNLSNFYVSGNIGTGNPGLNFDSSDFIDFDRTNNNMRFSAGGSVTAQMTSGNMTFGSNVFASTVNIGMNSAAGQIRRTSYQTGGILRWAVEADGSSESGSNAGSNFLLNSYGDTGSLIGTPLSITRSSMVMSTAASFNSGGSVSPKTDNAFNLGSASFRWGTVYAGTGTINTSGEATKTAIRDFSDPEIAVAKALASNPRIYQFCDAVAAKGADAARLHAGMIFEDVVAAFQAQSLDPRRYGIVCEDPAFKTVTVDEAAQTVPDLDENGQQKTVVGLRYDELAQFVIAGLAARLAIVEARLATG